MIRYLPARPRLGIGLVWGGDSQLGCLLAAFWDLICLGALKNQGPQIRFQCITVLGVETPKRKGRLIFGNSLLSFYRRQDSDAET